jgi:hypothetical protein
VSNSELDGGAKGSEDGFRGCIGGWRGASRIKSKSERKRKMEGGGGAGG